MFNIFSRDAVKTLDKASAEILLFILKQQGMSSNQCQGKQMTQLMALIAHVITKLYASVLICETKGSADHMMENFIRLLRDTTINIPENLIRDALGEPESVTVEEAEQKLAKAFGPQVAGKGVN
jgi:hypothetical protein